MQKASSSAEVQMGYALESFAYAHSIGSGWATDKLWYFRNAGIDNLSDLSMGCREATINLDLELFGAPKTERLSAKTVQRLACFLPGPMGFRCFRLAQMAAQKVQKGTADTEYIHRPENGTCGEEMWSLHDEDNWILRVDCAGFVRSCLKHVTKDPFVMCLSDRDFMRAKDFFRFFQSIPYTVLASENIPETDRRMKWRKVTDLRMIIPGDVICYRPRGNAAGGGAFSENDRSKDLSKLLKVVKTAQLWHAEGFGWDNLVDRNVAKDPKVKTWVGQVKTKLNAIGIKTVKQLYRNLDTINEKLKALDYMTLYQDTLNLMRECCETLAKNTGHIVFAAGPAVRMNDDDNESISGICYRIRVVHSTKSGIKNKTTGKVIEGVQEHYRRFWLQKDGTWTRPVNKTEPLLPDMFIEEEKSSKEEMENDDDEDDPMDDMEDDEDDVASEEEPEDEDQEEDNKRIPVKRGDLIVDVIAGRMCF